VWEELAAEAIGLALEQRYARDPLLRRLDRERPDPSVAAVAEAVRILGRDLPWEYVGLARLRLTQPCMSDTGIIHQAHQEQPAISRGIYKARLRRLVEFGRGERPQLDYAHPRTERPILPSRSSQPARRGRRIPGESAMAAANTARTQAAARRDVERARALLDGGGTLPARALAIARLRVDHPDAALAELAALAGMSKDVYAGRLRRLLHPAG
jgi:hypothetical protein